VKRLKDQSIARKALVLGIVPTLCAVLLVLLASMFAIYLQSRISIVQDLRTESAIVAANVAAPLLFNDQPAAQDTVDAFRAKNNIASVCVFDLTDRVFASFVQDSGVCQPLTQSADGGRLVFVQPIEQGGRHVGTVRVVGNYSRLYLWMRR